MTIDESLTADDIARTAEETYLFAFPMMMGYRFAYGMAIDEDAPSYRGPRNQIHSDPQTLGPSFRDVISPNADTPYSFATLDLRAEPVVLHVPEVTGRYYVIQLEDLYGFNANYVGTRVTGTDAGTYVLAGPGWSGSKPAGVDDVLRFETDLILTIGRTQLLGAADLPALTAVMSEYRMEPLSAFLGEPSPQAEPFPWPIWDDEASRDERFIGLLNPLLELCRPTHPEDADLFARAARIGVGAGVTFDPEQFTADQRDAIRSGIETARDKMADQASRLAAEVNGWMGLEGFGPRSYFKGNSLLRAGAAMAGWGANDKEEAYYPLARVDADGEALDGNHRYRLTFDTEPPNNAFWSVTLYDTSYDGTAGYLVDNPIDRYLINSTTEGLSVDDDGSLAIVIQHDRPEATAEVANWLPAPDGPFYLILRNYMPQAAALNGSWEPPPVKRVG